MALSYAITTIRGTEGRFQLTENYIPIASREYNDILYIFSGSLILQGNTLKILRWVHTIHQTTITRSVFRAIQTISKS
jgi:hypothetical protein